MRRVVYLGALVTTLALVAAPASAQDIDSGASMPLGSGQGTWHLNAVVGPSFGTLGSAPASLASVSFEMAPGLSLVGEAGTFRGKPVERPSLTLGSTAPSASIDDRTNAYHYNVNMLYRTPERNRLIPYVTAGVGAFRGAMVSPSAPIPGAVPAYRRATHSATNVGAGLNYRINRWLGASADYRLFVFNINGAPKVNRFTTGVSILFR